LSAGFGEGNKVFDQHHSGSLLPKKDAGKVSLSDEIFDSRRPDPQKPSRAFD